MGISELDEWDPVVARQVKSLAGPLVKWWFRAEVRGLDNIPGDGGALVVANHSGGMLTPDVLIFAPSSTATSVMSGRCTRWRTTAC